MDVTGKCLIVARYGFDSVSANRFVVIRVRARYGDVIRVNGINGMRYRDIWGAYENPRHEDAPIIDVEQGAVIVGGKSAYSQRTICVVGK